VTKEQLYMAIGIPMLFNAALIGLLIAYVNARFEKLDIRLDTMLGRWRAELRRGEERG
jgi:hypothetical protein